ncbi:MAG: PQQ-binding-like beta-propeller repeat protein [Acidobacteria bacterium]|nr:PQQ-binding-like beta-propeller repeat protein [Acidobacteriota bacterium]
MKRGFIPALAALLTLALALPAAAQTGPPGGGGTTPPVSDGSGHVTVSYPVHFDVSPPLREIEPIPPSPGKYLPPEHELPSWINRSPAGGPVGRSGPHVDQTWQGTLAMPATIMNFEGGGSGLSGFTIGGEPPDTNGDVGLNYYFQWLNTMFTIFDKTTGTVVYGPANGNTLWTGFGGSCETDNSGDPIVQFDQLANRWVVTQFAVSSSPYYECVAVSQTSDPTGSWYRYAYSYGTNFNDYPKMAVWPDGYYITYNMFANGSSWAGGEVCVFDRATMLTGGSATQQCFGPYSAYGGLLPSDLDGSTLPPSGSPNYVLAFGTNSLLLWKFHVDWTTPSNSSFNGPTTISVASFSEACGGGTCIPQQGTTAQLDSLADRLMYRLAYRNFGTYESLVVNHSVSGSSASSAVRWYELRDPNGTPTVYQSGTYEPDSTSRWMGSIAMDHMGNMAVGYSASSSSMYPSIWYAGRLVSDPVGTLPQAESVIVTGSGYHNGNSRWGDYSSMSIDPSDDCTFWYTQEYYVTSGSFDWHTRVASFKYPSCFTCTDPGQPTIDSITDDDACAQSGVTITYTAGSGATSHDLYVDTALAVSGFTSGSSYNPGDTASHSYVIRAVDSTCYTDSASQSFTDADNTPATPGAPAVSDKDSCALSGVDITWTGVTGATAYDLLVDGTTTIANVTSPYTYSPGDFNSHTYQVRARNASCTGAWSAATSGSDQTATAPATPAAPAVTDNSACALTGLTISWSAVANATSYDLMRDSTVIATGVAGTSYSDSPGDSATHTYQVKANNSCGQSSGWSTAGSGADANHSFSFAGIQTATDRDACDDTGVVLTWDLPAGWNDGGSGTRSFEVWRDGAVILTGISESSTSATDTTGTNGTSYSYSIRAVNGYSCASDGGASLSGWDMVGSPPTFSGLTSVTALSGSRCGLRLDWSAATPNCGSSVVYNVYRSTTSGFTPSSTSLLASCVTDDFYEDTTVTGGTTYYYVVRAEDNSTGHGGLCNGGLEETNTVEQSGSAGLTIATWLDDVESYTTIVDAENAGWSDYAAQGTNDWAVDTTVDHTAGGTNSFTAVDVGSVTDKSLQAPAKTVTSTSQLSFWHQWDLEDSSWTSGLAYDAAVLEISTDGGATWSDLGGSASAGGYDHTNISTSYGNPLGDRPNWSGTQTTWVQTVVDLSGYAGQSVIVRWRMGCDSSVGAGNWYVDDVQITDVQSGGTCTSTPDPVQSFTARSTSGQVKLEWVNPSAGSYGSTKICRGFLDPVGCTPIVTQTGTAGAYDTYTDTGLTNGTTYYYTAFVDDGSGVFSSSQDVMARPFDTTAQTKWAYNTAATALAPTGVRPGAIGTGGTWAVSNDRMLHGMNPTSTGGDWPRVGSFSWAPAGMNGPAQARPPVVPTTAVSGASQVVFLGSEDGHAYAVNAETGATLWQSAALGSVLLASPSGIFTDFGGAYNLLFIGSRDATADNLMYMLNPADGTVITSFNNGGGANGIGIISSSATVDYATNRIYFASRERSGGSTDTLWCLSFNGTSLTKVWSKPYGDVDGSPVLLNGRIYVGNNSGIVYAIDPADGSEIWHYATTDGPVKGYVTPEYTVSTPRKLYFSTTNTVWALTDNGSSASQTWQQGGVAGPSIPLVPVGGTALYIGSTNGSLYQLNAATGSIDTSVVLGDGAAAIGSPAMDVINNMAYVGSESGAVYGIALPLQ